MILKPNQVCPYRNSCKYNGKFGMICQGSNPDRKNEFKCDYVNDSGEFVGEGVVRNSNDLTGKMEFLQEG